MRLSSGEPLNLKDHCLLETTAAEASPCRTCLHLPHPSVHIHQYTSFSTHASEPNTEGRFDGVPRFPELRHDGKAVATLHAENGQRLLPPGQSEEKQEQDE